MSAGAMTEPGLSFNTTRKFVRGAKAAEKFKTRCDRVRKFSKSCKHREGVCRRRSFTRMNSKGLCVKRFKDDDIVKVRIPLLVPLNSGQRYIFIASISSSEGSRTDDLTN